MRKGMVGLPGEVHVGELVLGGFRRHRPARRPSRARLRERRRGGAILFKPNVADGPRQVASLARSIHAASPGGALLGVDQEGGRVARLGAPLLRVPAMRTVASWGDEGLAERIARALGTELAALGFTIDFAPVLDVNTCAENPVIGDRAFGDDAATCARFGVAWVRGLQAAGLLACGKHFPGHGDTTKDSHVDLPVVEQPLERLEQVELAPFRAATAAGVATMMTAHVVYPALDRDAARRRCRPRSCTDLRRAIGFDGVLVTDDLEMQAIAARGAIDDAAVARHRRRAATPCSSAGATRSCRSARWRRSSARPSARRPSGRGATRPRARAGGAAAGDRATARRRRHRSTRVVGGAESRAVAAEMAQRGPREGCTASPPGAS